MDDPDEALRKSEAGESVVLIVSFEAAPVDLGAAGPGRIAVLVGPPGDPRTRAAAEEMATELFG